MIHARFCIPIAAILALCFSPAQAQQSTAQTRTEADEALRQKAFDLLESLAGQLGVLQSPENRARLGANIADSLWEHDERRARTLLLSVQEDINAGLRDQTGDDREDSKRRMVFLQLRVNTVEKIAKHDGELALSFFKATESPDPSPVNEHSFMGNAERALELRLARQVAANNPEIALNLARQSLAKGYSNDLVQVLRRLKRQHPEQAATLYREIVAKLKRTNLLNNQDAFYFAQNLVRSFSSAPGDDSTFRDLIQIFIDLDTANECARKLAEDDDRRYVCYQIRSLVPVLARVDPARAASLVRTNEQNYDWYLEVEDVAEDGSIDDILALANKYPQSAGTIYWRAVLKAMTSGDLERARKLAESYNGDPRTKQSLLDLFKGADQRIAEAIADIKDIQSKLDAIPQVDLKIAFLMRSASAVAPTDRKAAEKLRDQASALLETMKPGKDQIELQLGFALAYCSENDARGVAQMASIVPKLNELVAAAAKLDGYETNHLRDGEWNMSNEGTLGQVLTGLAQNAGYFAWCDFDRALSIAGDFERPEIRLIAQVKLAQGILAGRPKGVIR